MDDYEEDIGTTKGHDDMRKPKTVNFDVMMRNLTEKGFFQHKEDLRSKKISFKRDIKCRLEKERSFFIKK
ncbi:hypothetical protein [uncultured Paraglaciecola sp.]|uniref:hypothetical protein n=1 Tax=uncultured Paraglaciecola sp. TaxID=1765024 RepID=UPI0026293C43|nr:hypothetical protein [uncultured Paraglaciecola sp.]